MTRISEASARRRDNPDRVTDYQRFSRDWSLKKIGPFFFFMNFAMRNLMRFDRRKKFTIFILTACQSAVFSVRCRADRVQKLSTARRKCPTFESIVPRKRCKLLSCSVYYFQIIPNMGLLLFPPVNWTESYIYSAFFLHSTLWLFSIRAFGIFSRVHPSS